MMTDFVNLLFLVMNIVVIVHYTVESAQRWMLNKRYKKLFKEKEQKLKELKELNKE